MKKIYSLFIALLVAGSMMATVVSIDFSQQGYENEQVISSVALDEHTFVSFDYTYAKHPAKYYNYGTAVRVYPGSDILIEFNEFNVYKITRVVLEYGEGDPGNELKPLIGNFDGSTWTGKRESVKFTVGGSTGHRRIKKVTVTYNEDSSDPGNYIDPSAELDAGFGFGSAAYRGCATGEQPMRARNPYPEGIATVFRRRYDPLTGNALWGVFCFPKL